VHVVATYPSDGQGTLTGGDAGDSCDTPTPDCAVPTDAPIELRFDRFLLPSPGMLYGFSLYTGDAKNNRVGVVAEYDLLERVVILRHPAALHAHTLYTVEITPGPDPSQGFWAFDGAPLEKGELPLRFSFMTGGGPLGTAPAPPAAIDDCVTLAAGPLNSCVGCHKDPPAQPPTKGADFISAYPPMGLSLTDWGLRYTAISHVAHEAETGDEALAPGVQNGPRFGAEMALIQPGAPEKSYLVYKLLRKPENYALGAGETCPVRFHAPVSDGACTPPDDAELTRLREWFVLGDPMPLDRGAAVALSRADLHRVISWIAGGASCPVP